MGETQRLRENDRESKRKRKREREQGSGQNSQKSRKTRQAKANIPSFVKPKIQFELAFEASSFIIKQIPGVKYICLYVKGLHRGATAEKVGQCHREKKKHYN